MEEKKITAYKGFDKDMTPRLKPIPTNTVVHTPTQEEAKELLTMLVQNRWSVDSIDYNAASEQHNGLCYRLRSDKTLDYDFSGLYQERGYTILTLAEFKERYCEEEKPRGTDIDGKFHCGDKVITTTCCPLHGKGWIGIVVQCHESDVDVAFGLMVVPHIALCDLELYTESETKPTEDMETKEKQKGEKGNNPQNSQLNLCELLKGHEGEVFYSPIYGEVTIEFDKKSGLVEMWPLSKRAYLPIASNGHLADNPEKGQCLTFPSRALYEQYPLDPYTAWMKWQEEQKKHWVSVTAWIDDLECESDTAIDTDKIYFRTPADREKCLSEIKAIINKYSK